MIWSCWPCVFWSADVLTYYQQVPIHPRRRVSRCQPCPIPVGQTLIHALKISVSLGMRTSLFMAGREQICKISWTSKDYKEAKVVLLEENCRSTKTILQAANGVIKNNRHHIEKSLDTKWRREEIVYYRMAIEQDEAVFVAKTIESLVAKLYKHRDFAVSLPDNAQSRTIEEAFSKSQHSYTMVGAQVLQRKEIRGVIAYLNDCQPQWLNISFERIINEPKRGWARYSGWNSWFCSNAESSLLDASANIMLWHQREDCPSHLGLPIILIWEKDWTSWPLQVVEESLTRQVIWQPLTNQGNLSQAHREYPRVPIYLPKKFWWKWRTVETDQVMETLSQLLERFWLWLPVQMMGPKKLREVTLMTLHAAKGLGLIVFLIGMEENVFPLSRAAEDPDELEENVAWHMWGSRGRSSLLDQCNSRLLLDGPATTARRVSSMRMAPDLTYKVSPSASTKL